MRGVCFTVEEEAVLAFFRDTVGAALPVFTVVFLVVTTFFLLLLIINKLTVDS